MRANPRGASLTMMAMLKTMLTTMSTMMMALAFLGCSAETIKQNLAIGAGCATAAECGTQPQFACDKAIATGYCTKDCKNDQDCPSEAICAMNGGAVGGCRKKCNGTNDCRASSGFVCRPASSDPGSLASHGFCDAPATSLDAGQPADMSMPAGDAAKGG